ncbi:unnamed protein product [Cylicocyclus nassatus]|uniref:BTB domain-containing protein n=1 Tax=Cylicocyclus nassatus TaxID=53992 RepID=A0AA36DQ42_CYLNA|nr:unnamed protein product [Cylicocyclus nassatus]
MSDNRVQAHGEVVKINVGGTIFETYLSTLMRVDNTVLSAMAASWRNQEVLFVDRSPTQFAKILDYLRDSENFTPPLDDGAREELRKEAEFYNMPGLVEMCSPEVFRVGDSVQWRQSVVESYYHHSVARWIRKNRTVECPVCYNDFKQSLLYKQRNPEFLMDYIVLLHGKEHTSSAIGSCSSMAHSAKCSGKTGQLLFHNLHCA